MKPFYFLIAASLLFVGCGGPKSTGVMPITTDIHVFTGPLGGNATDALPDDLVNVWQEYPVSVKGVAAANVPEVDVERIDSEKPIIFSVTQPNSGGFDAFVQMFAIRSSKDPVRERSDRAAFLGKLRDATIAPRGVDFAGEGTPPATLADPTVWANFQKNLGVTLDTFQSDKSALPILGYDPDIGKDGDSEVVGTHEVICFTTGKALRAEISRRISQAAEADLAAGTGLKHHNIFVLWLAGRTGAPPQPETSDATTETPQASTSASSVQNGVAPSSAALPLRVITRPFAKIYADASLDAIVKVDNVPAFSIFNVVDRKDGWYEVSAKEGAETQGWMAANDVAEWKHNLVVEYAHPDGRHPVLMFADKDKLKQVVELTEAQRIEQAKSLYQAIDTNTIPQEFPVSAVEPKQESDSARQFYLLPIVDFDTGSDFHDAEGNPLGREPRLLRLAAMTRERGSHAVAASPENDFHSPGVRELKVDLVFVMDLTRSMGPFADRTVQMMHQVVDKLQQEDGMRFGFWAYRDEPAKCPGIEFLTKNYTPGLLTAQDFLPVLSTVRETKVDSIDYEEDVLSGVHDAVENTAWRPDALHFLVLVGDAPGREPNELDPDPYHDHWDNPPIGTGCGMNAESIRRLADDKKIYLFPIYLSNPKWTDYDDAARTQWGRLGENRNLQASGGSALVMINGGGDTSLYGQTADTLSTRILDCFQQARSGTLNLTDESLKPPPDKITTPEEASATTLNVADNMFRGAFVDWLGDKATTPAASIPNDVTAWAVDKDLQDPTIQSLEVKVFLTKNQLDSLSKAVDHVLNAMSRQQTDSEDFFTALQAVSAYSQARPEQIQTPDSLAKSGLVPAFITELPYRSQILSMNADDWKNLTAQELSRIRDGLDSKLKFYREFHDNSTRWQALNPGDDPDEWVAALPLDQLP